MELQLVSFKQAEKLKDLGFPQELFYGRWYYPDVDSIYAIPFGGVALTKNYIPAPSLDLAVKWLREKKGIPIYPEPYYPNNTLKWVCKAKYYMGKNNWSTSAFDTSEKADGEEIVVKCT